MTDYIPTIGLEIHAELKTRSKMFCGSANDPDEKRPNWNVCPVCMGYPGTLPVINREAVKQVLKVGIALGGTIANYTEFDRKNYFYPDIPKGYQISQYAYPLVKGGSLNGISITRVHLEEDTARSQHAGDFSLVDFNRAGVPLMELVTEPVIRSAKEAGDFARELQLLLRTLEVSDADMEKGNMRLEANISVSKDPKKFGVKTEVKNINSFSYAEKAIEYEIKRHIEILESGGEVEQETRGWDSVNNKTFSQRKKESSHDYRYFPEPDLPKLVISEIPEFSIEELKKEMPELPWERRERYLSMGLKEEDAKMFVADFKYGKFFDAVVEELGGFGNLTSTGKLNLLQIATNYIVVDLAGLLKGENVSLNPKHFVSLIIMISNGVLSSRGAKDTLAIMVSHGGDPKEIAEREGLLQQSDESALKVIVDQVIEQNENVVAEYKAGKEASLQFLVGQGMKISKGSANPGLLAKLLKEKLL